MGGRAGARRNEGGGFSLSRFMAAQTDGVSYDFTRTSTTWQDVAGTTAADDVSEPIGRVDDIRVGSGSPHNATQASGTQRAIRQAAGVKGDGSDDNLLTTYYAGPSANSIVASVVVPASLSSARVIAGLSGNASGRFYIGVTAAGLVVAAVGNKTFGDAAHVGISDLRGREVVVALSVGDTTVKLFADMSEEHSSARSGIPTTSVPAAIFAYNNNGSVATFFPGHIKKIVLFREFLTLRRYLQLRNALLAV